MALFQVYAFEYDGRGRHTGDGHFWLNISEEHLRDRIVAAWDAGEPLTYNGETLDASQTKLRIFETEDRIERMGNASPFPDMEARGREVTNDWITGAPGSQARVVEAARLAATPGAESPLRDHRRVMVVHGRNSRARDAMFQFLRSLGLDPIEWDAAVAETGTGSPHNLDAVRAAMEIGQAVVVVLTAEDRAGLLPDLVEDADDEDAALRGQPRQNVILEAGLAMGLGRDRVILVELGSIRRATDFDGLNTVRLTNAAPSRQTLRSRLQTAGCAVNENGSDWTRPEAGGDFEAAVISWRPERIA